MVGRVVMPMWRNAHHRFRVAAVVPESDNVVSVYVTGRDLDRLPARAGQFFIWRFPGHNGWWQANPFSLSAAPDGRYAAPDRQGRRHDERRAAQPAASAPGSSSRAPTAPSPRCTRHRPAALLIAGGVGVTPIRALLEEATGPAVVLYRVHTTADAVLLPELQALARRRGAQVHVLAGRTGSGNAAARPVRAGQPRRAGARHRATGTCSSAVRRR